jgi:hypothetical protein
MRAYTPEQEGGAQRQVPANLSREAFYREGARRFEVTGGQDKSPVWLG